MSPGTAITCAGLLSALAYGWLARISLSASHPPLTTFFACMAVASAGWLAAYHLVRHRNKAFARAVIGFAVLFRLIGFFGGPLYEDDFYRYLWDGYRFGTAGSPYGSAPSQFFGREDLPGNLEEILGGVNNPDIPTIYGPVCQMTFLLAWWIAPGQLWPLKLIYLAADLGLMALIWRVSRRSSTVLLYAWCPLVIKEIAFTAHTDILAALLLFSAWLLRRTQNDGSAGSALGAAVAAKITIVFAAPLILWRARPRVWATCAATLAVIYAPFLWKGATDMDGLRAFGQQWEFNSFGFALLQAAFGPETAKVASLAGYGAFCAFVCLRRPAWLRGDILLGAFFVLAPVVNPWYLILIAPFVAIYPSATGVTALAAVLLSYITRGNLALAGPQFEHPVWVRCLQGGSVLAAFVWDLRKANRTRGDAELSI